MSIKEIPYWISFLENCLQAHDTRFYKEHLYKELQAESSQKIKVLKGTLEARMKTKSHFSKEQDGLYEWKTDLLYISRRFSPKEAIFSKVLIKKRVAI